jgi:hypothetical protein
MLQSNSRTQNIFPCGNIFASVQANNIKGELCSLEATEQALIIDCRNYLHPSRFDIPQKTQALVSKAIIIAGIKFALHQRNGA